MSAWQQVGLPFLGLAVGELEGLSSRVLLLSAQKTRLDYWRQRLARDSLSNVCRVRYLKGQGIAGIGPVVSSAA